MKLDLFRLKNFRSFAELEVPLHPQLTVLVAESGQGKSTLLDAIRIVLWPFVNSFDLARDAFSEPENAIAINGVRLSRLISGDMARQLHLFGSCNRPATCVDHKDKFGDYPHNDLTKPDIDDPDALFVFIPGDAIRPRANRQPQDNHCAVETIRILALDGALNQIRQAQIAGYLQTAEAFAEMAPVFDEDEWLPLLQEEIQNTAHLPFATAIKHVLTRQSDYA